MLITRSILVELVSEESEPIGPLPLLDRLGDECSILLLKIAARRERHEVNLRSQPDAQLQPRDPVPDKQPSELFAPVSEHGNGLIGHRREVSGVSDDVLSRDE